jgi:hypothetical protein
MLVRIAVGLVTRVTGIGAEDFSLVQRTILSNCQTRRAV